MRAFALPLFACLVLKAGWLARAGESKAVFTVTLDQIGNGSVKVEPVLPQDGRVGAGTVVKVTATPAAEMKSFFDRVFYPMRGTAANPGEGNGKPDESNCGQSLRSGADWLEPNQAAPGESCDG